MHAREYGIRIATLNGATSLGIQHRSGGIEADLLIVRGNPAERIEDISNVEMVFTNGIAYDPKPLLAKVRGTGWLEVTSQVRIVVSNEFTNRTRSPW